MSGGSIIYGQLGRAIQDLGMVSIDMKLQTVSIASGLGHSLAICQIARSEGTRDNARHCFVGMEPEFSAWKGRPGESPSGD